MIINVLAIFAHVGELFLSSEPACKVSRKRPAEDSPNKGTWISSVCYGIHCIVFDGYEELCCIPF